MTLKLCAITLLIILIVAPAFSQSWQSGNPGASLSFTSALIDGAYVWTFSNISNTQYAGTPDYDVVAWSFEPFNVAAPSYVEAPEGWQWVSSNGWNVFEIKKESEKYKVGGSALEPGESITFKYTPDPMGKPVNSGGPAGGNISFVSHVGAVVPLADASAGRYQAIAAPLGMTWHEVPGDYPPTEVPEPSGIIAMLIGSVAITGHVIKRRRTALCHVR